MFWFPALFAAAFGMLCLLAGVVWRWAAARLVERAAGEGIEARALRDGGAIGVALVGFGLLSLAVGYLGTMGSLVARAGTENGPLAALADAAPLYDVGAATLLVGFGVLVASGLILVACEAR